MKKIIVSTALVVTVFIAGVVKVQAADKEPSYIVKEAFAKEFTSIKEVKWDENSNEGLYIANFIFNNESLQAYFSEEGEFLGTTRKVSGNQFPILVTKALDDQYPNAKVISAFEYNNPTGLSYYITVSTKKGTLVLKATGSGDLTVYQRQK